MATLPKGVEGSQDHEETKLRAPRSSRRSATASSRRDDTALSPPSLAWESDGEVPSSSGQEQRKLVESTTPTLIDEQDFADDDEEQEMVSLERLRTSRFFAGDESHLTVRRTPGAQMYRSSFHQESMRRTPGATQMHRSAVPGSQESEGQDSSGLGYGLTLSTPVASSSRSKPLNLVTDWQSSLSEEKLASEIRPPLPRGTPREIRGAFAPMNIARASSGHGAYSPNTLRLSEDLGNLLLEEEEEEDAEVSESTMLAHSPFGHSRHDGPESWTAPYVIGMDAPSRVPRSSTNRGRRGKADALRRSRGHDRPTWTSRSWEEHTMPETGGFLQYTQQPKPLRNVHLEHFGQSPDTSQFGFGLPTPSFSSNHYGETIQDGNVNSAPRLFNFGGAFAPPSKNLEYQSPAHITPSTHVAPGPFFQQTTQQSFGASGNYGATSYQNPFQGPGQPQFAVPKLQHQFGSQPIMFGGTHHPVSQSPTFNFPPPNVGYPMQPMPPQDFIPVMHRPHVPQFGPPPQSWPSPPMEMQYGGMAATIDHSAAWHSSWQMGEYVYAMPRPIESPALSMTPTPSTWTPEPDLISVDHATTSFVQQDHAPSPGPKQNKKGPRKPLKKAPKPVIKADTVPKVELTSQNVSGKKSPIPKKGKKKNQSRGVASSATDVDAPPDDSNLSRRAELEETAEMKAAFKEFSKHLRAEERSSFVAAKSFALKALSENTLPPSIHWKVYLELADMAKRANQFGEARHLYKKVCQLQPYAIQGWLEFSKLEEESGNMNTCANILRAGIEYCEYNDGLFARAIKHEEKMGNLTRARELLSRLKHLGIENVWRTVLEGALLEARAGNHVKARRVLKYLMHHVPWYGPLYLEAYKLEKNLGRSQEALEVVERGLRAIPRYGPLWFGAFRLCEELDHASRQFLLPLAMSMIDRATMCVSKEIIWKVHLEAAHMLERSAVEFLDGNTDPPADTVMHLSRKRFALTILTCPPNLRWKVWLASGRMEVAAGNADRARLLFQRAHKVVPDKGRAMALLECARLEEFVGDVELAQAILCKSRSLSGSDWKVWLESVLLEIRCGNRARAIELAELALQQHSGTGRLWASLIQLRHYEQGEEGQFQTLKLALNAVPKSGEVWCEGARIHLNPFSRTFDLPSARRHLSFATKFTPQYGDGFLESLRLEIVDQWLLPVAKLIWESTRKGLELEGVTDIRYDLKTYVLEVSRALSYICKEGALPASKEFIIDAGMAKIIASRLQPGFRDKMVDLSTLRQRCANADPNYGLLWFHCRDSPSGTARQILSKATELMNVELRCYAHIYLTAFIRRFAVLAQLDRALELKSKSEAHGRPSYILNTAQWEESMMAAYLSAPSLDQILEGDDKVHEDTVGMLLLESTMAGSSFVSGLVALCDEALLADMTSPSDKRKALFGTDALFS